MDHQLLSVEDAPEILSFRTAEDEPLWLYMRYPVLYDILSRKYLQAEVLSASRPLGLAALQYMAKAEMHNLFCRRERKSILLYTTSRGIVQDGKYKNQYVDDFMNCFPSLTFSIEHPPLDWKWYANRGNQDIVYNGINLALSSAAAKHTADRRAAQQAKKLFAFVKQKVQYALRLELSADEEDYAIRQCLYEYHRIVLHSQWLLKQALKRKTKLAVIVGGSYSRYAYMIRKLKEAGIRTADLQHGYITNANTVYNYAESLLRKDDIKSAVPDYLLTYGSWWNTQTNLPYRQKIVIGSPFRTNSIKRFQRNSSGKTVVLIGCARNTAEYLALARELCDRLEGYQVIFRPHPAERYEVSRRLNGKTAEYQIDFSPDLYSLLQKTDFLISEISTVLFEAIGLVPHCMIWRTPYSSFILPRSPFQDFTTSDELIRLIQTPAVQEMSASDFWDENWEKNYRRFIADAGGLL